MLHSLGGAALLFVFFLPWQGAHSWEMLRYLQGPDFVRQLGLLIGGPLAYLAELCIGAPVLALLTRLGWAQRAPVVVIAALLGMPAFGLPLALVAGATVADGPPSFLLLIAAGGAIFGGVSGWTFWWMTLRRTEPAL